MLHFMYIKWISSLDSMPTQHVYCTALKKSLKFQTVLTIVEQYSGQ